jgi:putative transposase
MPAKNTIKIYVADGIYHIYNRGVEKRVIFEDHTDYKMFLHCLKEALLSPDKLLKQPHVFTLKGESFKGVMKPVKNYFGNIELLAYCLMPNHFHLIIKQKNDRIMDSFMRSIATRYSIYFNKKYRRVGSLFQGPYKAVLVDDDIYLLHLSRYLHRNSLLYTKNLIDAYSSYADYLGKRHTEWVNSQLILAFFQPTKLPFLLHTNSYQSFVEFDREYEDFFNSSFALGGDDL